MSVLSPVFCQTPAVTCRGRVEAGRRKMSVSVGSVPRPVSVHLAALLLLMSRSRGSDHGWGKCGPGCGGGVLFATPSQKMEPPLGWKHYYRKIQAQK